MKTDGGKKVGSLEISDGGKAHERLTHAERELEKAQRAVFYAMCGKDGKSVSRNFRNIARGSVKPLRVLAKRLREAKLARCPKAYDESKRLTRALDRYIDAVHGKDVQYDTGEFRPAA